MKNYTEIIHDSKTMRGYHHKNNNKKLVLMLHGFTGNKTETRLLFRTISEHLELDGFDSLRMDYFGHGESDGQFRDMTLQSLNAQVQALMNYVSSLEYEELYLLGFSMGGMLALQNLDNRFKKTILMSPATKMPDITKKIFEETSLENGSADIGGLELSRKFYESIIDVDALVHKEEYKNPILFVTGEKDQVVFLEDVTQTSNEFFDASLIVLKNGDHSYSSLKLREDLYKNIVKFLND